jgi:hypothetical protein
MTISNSISIPRGLKAFMLKNCKDKVDFLGNSEVAFFIHPVDTPGGAGSNMKRRGQPFKKGTYS